MLAPFSWRQKTAFSSIDSGLGGGIVWVDVRWSTLCALLTHVAEGRWLRRWFQLNVFDVI